MTDQCTNCTVRGDFKACQATPCSKHEDWHAIQLKQKLEAAEAKLEKAEADIYALTWDISVMEYANKLKAGEV